MFSSREGVTIDSVAAPLRRWLLNPVVTVSIALALSCEAVRSGVCAHLCLGTLISPVKLQIAAYLLASASVLLWLNDYLDKQFANNWVTDPLWNWDKEIVVVTGGSSGIGASISQQLMARNPRTRIVIVDYAPLDWTPPAEARLSYYQCDLGDSKALKATCARIKDEVGDPTVLFNNAGLIRGVTVMEGSYADVEATIRTNLIAPMLMIKEFLPSMVEHDHGHIVHTGSLSCYTPPALIADYAATKAGLVALHEALQLELRNIHKAPRVRLTMGIFCFIRTPLVGGHPNQHNFILPFLHADSVAERLVDGVYSGFGSTMFMPGITAYMVMLKSGPDWLFRLLRQSTSTFGINFSGRQQLDSETGRLRKA